MLLKVIERSGNTIILEESLFVLDSIILMNREAFSPQNLRDIRNLIMRKLARRNFEIYGQAKKEARDLIRKIDSEYMSEDVDFVHNPTLKIEVERMMKTPEGEAPTIDQISRLIDKIKDVDPVLWLRYFNFDYFKVIAQKDGIPTLIKLGNVSKNIANVGMAIGYLYSLSGELTPETKRQTISMLNNFLQKEYKLLSSGDLEEEKGYIEQLKQFANIFKLKLENLT